VSPAESISHTPSSRVQQFSVPDEYVAGQEDRGDVRRREHVCGAHGAEVRGEALVAVHAPAARRRRGAEIRDEKLADVLRRRLLKQIEAALRLKEMSLRRMST
jgi:hypothetical protein